jgi:uncharacterized membrane protein
MRQNMDNFRQATRGASTSQLRALEEKGDSMFSMPNPLHPAIVHFRIVLLLIGAAVAVMSVFVHRWHLAWVAAALLTLGAVGSFFAVKTGDSAQESVGKLPPAAEALVDAHEKCAERTEIVGAVAAALAIGAAVLGSLPAWSRRQKRPAGNNLIRSKAGWITPAGLALTARVLTASIALTACFFVYETARRGGELVYAHGVGVKSIPVQVSGNPPAEND